AAPWAPPSRLRRASTAASPAPREPRATAASVRRRLPSGRITSADLGISCDDGPPGTRNLDPGATRGGVELAGGHRAVEPRDGAARDPLRVPTARRGRQRDPRHGP